MTDEPKPCPFCGLKPSHSEVGFNCSCFAWGLLDGVLDLEEWNQAWCWKEIDRYKNIWRCAEESNITAKKEIARLRRALEWIVDAGEIPGATIIYKWAKEALTGGAE